MGITGGVSDQPSIAGKHVRPVYRNEGSMKPGEQELPFYFAGRGRDVAYDLEDVDSGKIVRRGLTERQECE